MRYGPGYNDLKQGTFQAIDNPFGTRLSPMSQSPTRKELSDFSQL